MEASIVRKFNLLIIMGVILIKLISSPIHAVNQDEEEIVIKVPTISEGKKISILFLNRIKKKKKIYKWGMNPVASVSLPFFLRFSVKAQ